MIPWPDYKESQKFLQIGVGKLPEMTIESELFPERMAFWEELSANLTYDPADGPYLPLKQPIEEVEFAGSGGAPVRYDEITISLPTLLLLFTYLSIVERNC